MWTQLPFVYDAEVDALSVAASNDVWVLGTHESGSAILADHFDGNSWTEVDASGPALNFLAAASQSSSTDAWMVGTRGFAKYSGFAEHWDGSAWKGVPLASPTGFQFQVGGVADASSSSAWVSGVKFKVDKIRIAPHSYRFRYYDFRPLVEHWNGTAWSMVGIPSPGRGWGLGAIAHSGGNVWAVGESLTGTFSSKRTLVEAACCV